MKLRYVVMDYSEGQKPNVFVKLVKYALHCSLFLEETVITKHPSSMKARNHSGEFLNQRLEKSSLPVPKHEGVTVSHSVWGRNQNLKSSEG